ncbi:MAG TPA: hypothetical protein VK854_06915 [Woeseiaceae bacterium]|nr:hypothetical protein [Woeseiaceae bacterium]
MNTYTRFIITCFVLAVAGCGGGGSGDSPAPNPPAPPPPPPPTDALPGGHWFGTVTNDLHAVTEEYIAMVDENGRFRFASVDSAVQMSGNFAIVGDTLAGDGTAFADAGVFWLDATSATPVTIDGTISSRSEMSGTWTTTAGERGTFEFFYDPTFYERASPLDLLAGSWIAYDELMNPEATFTIAADGSFTGQNVHGCNSTGQFAIIDEGFNLYGVQSTIVDCALAGDYVGLAFLGDLLVPNDALILANDNGSRAFLTGLQK